MKKKAKTGFTAREVAALIEDLRSQLSAVAEGISFLKDQGDTMMGMIAKNAEGITTLRFNSSFSKDEITKINGKLAKIEDDIRIIKTDFGKRLIALEASHK